MLTHNHKVITYNDYWIQSKLKPYTLRLLYADGVIPDFQKGTGRQISVSPNIWDLTYNNTDWTGLLSWHKRPNPQRPELGGYGELLKVLDGNTTGVINMESMFQSCEQLQSVCLFDTSAVTSMRAMFNYCSSLTAIPWFNTSKVNCMYQMLAFTPIETIPWLDTHNCYDFGEMFWNCENLKYIPCIDTHKAGTMDISPSGLLHMDFYGMFNGCTSLKTIPQLDTSNGQCMIYFLSYSGVERIPEIDTHNVKDFTAMFRNSALKEIPRLSIDSLINGSIWGSEYNKPATDAMFAYCHNVETGMLDFYNRLKAYSDNKGWNSEYTFNNCGDQTTSGMAERAYIPTEWGGDMYQQRVITSGTNGSVSAVPDRGWEGTTVTLYPTPISDWYEFDSYSTTGCTIYDDNKIDLTHATVYENSTVYVHGNFRERDDKLIGGQRWKTKDLAIDDGQGGIVKVDNVTANGVNLGTVYYYTWAAAVRVANTVNGYHLPSRSEWTTLLNYTKTLSDYSLTIRSTSGWDVNGNNETGFNALPVGYKSTAGGTTHQLGTGIQYWSSTSPESGRAYAYTIQAGTPSNWPIEYSEYTNEYYPVRLIKDS